MKLALIAAVCDVPPGARARVGMTPGLLPTICACASALQRCSGDPPQPFPAFPHRWPVHLRRRTRITPDQTVKPDTTADSPRDASFVSKQGGSRRTSPESRQARPAQTSFACPPETMPTTPLAAFPGKSRPEDRAARSEMTRHEATKAVLQWDSSGGVRREGMEGDCGSGWWGV